MTQVPKENLTGSMMKLAVLLLCCVVLSACSLSLQGDNGLTVAGNSTSDVVTLALDGSVVRGVLTDSGNATGSDNWLEMLGEGNVTISASGHTITISCDSGEGGGGNATYALDSDKLDGEHGSYYLTTTGTAADSTLFYGFTAIDWTNIIDAQIVSGTSGDSDKLDGLHGASYLLQSKTISFTRVLSAASGDVAYTGVGFVPTSLEVYAVVNNSSNAAWGFSDSSKAGLGITTWYGASAPLYWQYAYVITIGSSSSAFQYAVVKSYDADGFTLTWTKANSPTGTASVIVKAMR